MGKTSAVTGSWRAVTVAHKLGFDKKIAVRNSLIQ